MTSAKILSVVAALALLVSGCASRDAPDGVSFPAHEKWWIAR